MGQDNTDTPRSALDWVLEAVSFAALAAAAAEVGRNWSSLPARIPVHFGASGTANGWGGKGMLLVLLAATAAMSVLLTAAEKYQRLINVPMKVDRESQEVRRLLRSMVIVMKAVITVSFFWITEATIRTALGGAAGLGQVFLPLFLGGTFVPVVYYTLKLNSL